MQENIAVIGAGSWGSSIANILADNNHNIYLYSNNKIEIDFINKNKICYIDNNIKINEKIYPVDNINNIINCNYIFIVTPSHIIENILNSLSNLKKNFTITICSKGLDGKNNDLVSNLINDKFPQFNDNLSFLSGPNFANEVSLKSKTITNIGSKNKEIAKKISILLNNDYFETEIIDDIIAMQIFGACKNIMAIGCGILEGLNHGYNAKSRLIIKFINEIAILLNKLNSDIKYIISPSGFGDIFLTCSTNKSRNNDFGFKIAQNYNIKELLSSNVTYEGVIACQITNKLISKLSLDLPLFKAINDIITEKIDVLNIIDII